jgi:hypothetical protein
MSPIPIQHEIGRHGQLTWSSDASDAGPYRIGSRWFVLASFGERIPAAAVPGTSEQLAAFYTSRAVFHALRDLTDGSSVDELAVKAATRVARDIVKSKRAQGHKLDVDVFEAAVREKLALVLDAVRR